MSRTNAPGILGQAQINGETVAAVTLGKTG